MYNGKNNIYDVIIVGAGPAGISASLYTTRANLKTLILYKETSALEGASWIENYYGFEKGISGKDLYQIGINQSKNLGTEILKEEVTNIKMEEKDRELLFCVQTLNSDFIAKKVILATGNKKKKPKINGIKEYEGKGISYCAVCDGFFYRNKNVAVLGDGDYAISEVKELKNIAKSITILTNGKEIPQYRNEELNTQIIDKKIREFRGENRIKEIAFDDNTNMKIDGVFIAQGVAGSIDFARKLGARVEKDKILVNEKMETSIKGLYACGDCTGGIFQIAKAVYEGMIAGISCYKNF